MGAPWHDSPVHALTVLYDADCALCAHLRAWLLRRPALVPLRTIAAGSRAALARFPDLDPADTLREITVIGDRGQVYRGSAAFVMCLWALADHRSTALWLATPAGAPFARAAMLAAAKYRGLTATGCGCGGGPCDVPDTRH